MSQESSKTRFKIFGSMAVLAIVMIFASIAQFTEKERPDPYRQDGIQAEPRAVFGDLLPPAPVEPKPMSPVQPKPPEAESSRSRTTTASTPQINDLLNRWRDTVVRGDVNAHTILYAPKMDQFFRRRNVTRATVHREKSRMMELYPKVRRYDISDVRVESQRGNEAVVSFRKDWDMRGDRPFSGAERQRLKLRRISGDWKIVSEEELKVYWVKRG